MLPVLSNNTVK